MKKVVVDVKFVEVQNVVNMEKIERLNDLLEEVYHAEDVIDGCFNSEEFEDLSMINEQYEFTLRTLRDFMSIISTTIKDEESK